MATKFITIVFSLLFSAKLAMGEPQFAERVPQLLHHRSFLGGISLYATTPETGEDGVCPSYTQICPGSCCPDGCCPVGTYCFVNGDYCCPTDEDCSSLVDSTPSCANSTWIMYARPASAVSPYFCCEPDQIALLPNLCVPNNGSYPAASLAPMATQIGGKPPIGSPTKSGTSSAVSTSEITSTASAPAKTNMTSLTEVITPKGSSTGSGATATGKGTTAPASTGSSTASSTATLTPSAASSSVSDGWPWGLAVLVVALGLSLRLIM